MRTAESARARALFRGRPCPPSSDLKPPGDPRGLGAAMFKSLRAAGVGPAWQAVVHKSAGPGERAGMCISLREGEEVELRSIGRGNHKPFEVVFRDGHDAGVVSTYD